MKDIKIQRYTSTIPKDGGYMKLDDAGWWCRIVDIDPIIKELKDKIKELESEIENFYED